MIGRRRKAGQSDPIKVARREARAARREARIVNAVHRSLQVARVREHPIGGGTLLTEPVLVFFRKDRGDVRVFDQDSKQVGSAYRFQDKAAKLSGYEIYGADDEVPLLVASWPAGWFRANFPATGPDYTVSDREGVEMATLAKRATNTSTLSVMVGGQNVGYLSPPGLRKGHSYDNESREVARITHFSCYVTEIEPYLEGPRLTVAVVASIICQEKDAKSNGM